MDETTVSSKYQVVIPKRVRESVGLKPGQKLMVMVKQGIISLVPVLELDQLHGIARGANTDGYREKVDRF
jgi:AbrB family looped-hinge helix DNA binding protein